MTDTLILEDPNDTGEIPTADPGPDTKNLAPYAVLPPALRRPTVEVPVFDLGDCRSTLDGELVPTGGIPGPDPTPPFPPPPPPPTPRFEDREPKSWLARMLYRGEHRAARR